MLFVMTKCTIGDAPRYLAIEDKEIAMMSVSREGRMLEHVSPILQADKEVVLAAVKNQGLALQFASDELRNDKEVVTAAVKSHPMAFAYASPRREEPPPPPPTSAFTRCLASCLQPKQSAVSKM